jgi:hypothetical protein
MGQKYLILLLLFTISCKSVSQKGPRQNQKAENIKDQVQSTLKLSPMKSI